MRSSIPCELCGNVIDSHLVADVQKHAGARCHEAANLLNCYTLLAELHRRAISTQDSEAARSAHDMITDAEVNLRKFLFQCRWPERARSLHYALKQ